jgi:4-carboxymuconolactone decarboxylase
MLSRIPLPQNEAMTSAQRAIRDSILATRPSLDGPFLAWLHAPGLAAPAEQLGAYCRYGTGLSLKESELLILTTATHFHCDGEWDIHGPLALEAGVEEADLALIRAGKQPRALDRRQSAILDFAGELLTTNRVGDDAFQKAQAALGIETLVNITGVVGYYTLVAMTLNAFAMRAS